MMSTNESFELHQTPGVWTAFRQQAWLLAASQRWTALTLTVLVVMMIIDLHVPAPVPGVLTLAIILLPVSAIWAILVWSAEGPNQRGYHWSLPVPRPAHDLARVAAGALYLIAMFGVLALFDAMMVKMAGNYGAFAAIDGQAWANYFIAPLVVYALAMPFLLWRDYAVVRWLLGGLVFIGVLTPILETQHIHVLSRGWEILFFSPDVGLGLIANGTLAAFAAALDARDTGPSEPWQTAAALWLAIGLLLTVVTATFRPDDIARIFRRGAAER